MLAIERNTVEAVMAGSSAMRSHPTFSCPKRVRVSSGDTILGEGVFDE